MILHVDMDAFFASIEQRDDPGLRGRPVVVGGDASKRGVVAAASYEARMFGVRSAMPMAQALRLCPSAIRRPARYGVYQLVAAQIRTIFHEFTPLVEPLSLDEAFLDVAGCEGSVGSPIEIGRRIKERVARECQLVASVGIGPVKFIAKLASDHGKPDGFVVVAAEEMEAFLAPLPIERLWGVGPKGAQRLRRLGITTIGDLQRRRLTDIERCLGSAGPRLWNLARGIDPRRVEPHADPQSVGHETTFAEDSSDPEYLRATLHELCDRVASRLRAGGLRASAIGLKIRFANFETLSRSLRAPEPINSTGAVWEWALEIWNREKWWERMPIRLLGVVAEGLERTRYVQSSLFDEPQRRREEEVDEAMDRIRQRFGPSAVVSADRIDRGAHGVPAVPVRAPRKSGDRGQNQ